MPVSRIAVTVLILCAVLSGAYAQSEPAPASREVSKRGSSTLQSPVEAGRRQVRERVAFQRFDPRLARNHSAVRTLLAHFSRLAAGESASQLPAPTPRPVATVPVLTRVAMPASQFTVTVAQIGQDGRVTTTCLEPEQIAELLKAGGNR